MDFILRDALPADMGAVLDLIRELAVFEKEPDAVEITVQDLLSDGFGERPSFHVFLAEKEGEVLGMALFYERYSTWKGKTIHLEDLIVKKAHRGKGIGRALYDKVLKFGNEKGYRRITWEVLDWNTNAIDFYTSTGARILDSWKVVHMEERSLHDYVVKN